MAGSGQAFKKYLTKNQARLFELLFPRPRKPLSPKVHRIYPLVKKYVKTGGVGIYPKYPLFFL